jgi:hypothetical protein
MDKKGKNGGTLRSFEKGKSGNLAGRPANRGLISQLMQEYGQLSNGEVTIEAMQDGKLVRAYNLNYETHGNRAIFAIIAVQLLRRALGGDMEAIKIILDRTEGRIPPPMDLGGQSNGSSFKVITYQPKVKVSHNTAFSEPTPTDVLPDIRTN